MVVLEEVSACGAGKAGAVGRSRLVVVVGLRLGSLPAPDSL